MPRDIVSEQQCNIDFVKTVEKYPCLYNFELPSYTRKDITDKAWEEVAEASKMTPSACRERWRNLRAVFMRTIRQNVLGTKKKPYYLADHMQFIIPFLQPTNMTEAEKFKMQKMDLSRMNTSRTSSAIPTFDIELEEVKVEDTDDDTGQSSHDWGIEVINTSQKRPHSIEEHYSSSKRSTLSMQPSSSIAIPESSDPVVSFMHSLLPELREMNSAQFKTFKRRVLVLIDDITAEMPPVPHDEEYITYEN